MAKLLEISPRRVECLHQGELGNETHLGKGMERLQKAAEKEALCRCQLRFEHSKRTKSKQKQRTMEKMVGREEYQQVSAP